MSPAGSVAKKLVELRPYQSAAIARTRCRVRIHKRILICAPTGSGKTLTAGEIIRLARDKGKRVLFVAHRKELIDQSFAALVRLGITGIGVVRASDPRLDLSQPVQVASIQTLARRPLLDPAPDLIFIDEAHRAASKGYQTYLYDAYPSATILGLTATPCRADNKPLRGSFDEIIEVAPYSELIANDYLAEPLVYSTPLLPDLSTVQTTAGDFNQEDLELAVNRGVLIGSIGDEWVKHNAGRRTVVFAVSVSHSKAIVAMFVALGYTAEHLDGETPEREREAILARLESGATQIVSNCNVLSEGWDMPSVKCLVLARPTKSLSLYMQQGGRALRPWNDITPIILDHAGNVDRHGLPHIDRVWSLTAEPRVKDESVSLRSCSSCFAYVLAITSVCPYCGSSLVTRPAPEVKKTREPIPLGLELRTIADVTADPRMGYFQSLAAECRRMGWKYGSAIVRFEKKHKALPPIGWIEALQKDYRRDAEWRARVKERKSKNAA